MSEWYRCSECGHETDFPMNPGDGPDFCPECRSIDSYEEVEDEDDEVY